MPYVYGILPGGHDTPWGLSTDLVVKVRQVIIEPVSKAKKASASNLCNHSIWGLCFFRQG